MLKRTPDPKISLEVSNEPDKVDIDPPILRGLAFDKAVYQMKDEAVLSVQYDDKSPLCGFHLRCKAPAAPFLIRFENQKEKAVGTFLVRQKYLSESSPGVGKITVPLREIRGLRQKGEWQITFLALEDKFHNLASKLPAEPATFTLDEE